MSSTDEPGLNAAPPPAPPTEPAPSAATTTPETTPPPPRFAALKARIEPQLPLIAFFGGFVWDSATLSRIDKLTDNLILLGYLLALGALLVVHTWAQRDPAAWPKLSPKLGWVDWLIQFFYGGLYSAYVVFYFKSASFGRTGLFLVAMLVLMVANEFFAEPLRLTRARVALYALCTFSFLLFFIPVMTGTLGVGVFTLAAVLSFGLSMGLATLMTRGQLPETARDERRSEAKAVLSVLGLMFVLDWMGVIPPVPLAILESGFFHNVERSAKGEYIAQFEPTWRPWRKDDRVFAYRQGDRVWCFTAIFAPTGLEIKVFHVWERWDDEAGAWVETNRVPLSTKGGREGGFRTYSFKRSIEPGDWRVRVESEQGRVLSTMKVEVVAAGEDPLILEERVLR